MKIIKLQTPNYNRGQRIKPIGLVWHHTGGSFNGSVAWCMDPKSKVAYHGIVDVNGDYTQLALDHHRVWANGSSRFKGRNDCNSFMISIAVSGDTTKRLLTDAEIHSMAKITIEKMKLYGFGLDMVTTHRVISPGRKNDVDVRAERAIRERVGELML